MFFSPWDLFGGPAKQQNVDIALKNETVYLFRDLRIKAKNFGLDLVTLYSLLWKRDLKRIRKDYLKDLKILCSCDDPTFVILNGSIHDHILRKKAPNTLKRELL